LEQVLPVVHHLADGRLGSRCDLDQVEQLLLSQSAGLRQGDDAALLAGIVNQPDLYGADLVIDTGVIAPSLGRGESVETARRSDQSILLG
jgi:hypothetical protein